jgi:glyceraldehyde-3-phosphate dehydrogenase/erythrose-4-phosphate dehydrogenase
VSCVDLTFKTEKAAKYEDICQAVRRAAEGDLKVYLV